MPDFNELKQKLCFVRDMKLRATSVSNIEVDEEFCRTDIGEKFLILDKKGEDSDDPEEEDLSTDEDINNRPKKPYFLLSLFFKQGMNNQLFIATILYTILPNPNSYYSILPFNPTCTSNTLNSNTTYCNKRKGAV